MHVGVCEVAGMSADEGVCAVSLVFWRVIRATECIFEHVVELFCYLGACASAFCIIYSMYRVLVCWCGGR